MKRSIWVAAGVVVENQRVLLSQRSAGTHLAGAWEFPGGKVEPGENPRDAVKRELREELDIDVHVGEILDVAFHEYGEKAITLLFFEAHRTQTSGEPRAVEVAAVKWAEATELKEAEFPPADLAILRKLRLQLARAALRTPSAP